MTHKREITIYDIASALNISASTVSRGLQDHPMIKKATKDRILQKAREMGYQHNAFASNLRKNSSNTIGVVVPRLDSYFMSKVISGIEKTANRKGYNLIINQSAESARKEISCVETMFNSRVDGLLLSLASNTSGLDHLDILYKKGIPVVFFDRTEHRGNSISIHIDNFMAAYQITCHLIDQGCKLIMHIGGNRSRNVYADRFQGYRKALKDHGLTFDPELALVHKLNEKSGTLAVQRLLQMNPRPDGIFAANDTTAVAAICALKNEGIRIPDDIAIAGFNNDPISRVVDPNLTTVNYPGTEMGELAASTLISQINKEESGRDMRTIYLKHSLIIRKSSTRR